MPERIRVVAVGYYGAPNVGDELLLAALAHQVHANGGELIAVSLNPEYTREKFGIEAVDYFNLGEVGRALAKSQLLVFGGGGIFQDHHPFNVEALYDPTQNDIGAYARIFYMARQFGLRTAIWAHGVGPLNHPKAREVVKDIFTHVDDVTLRDHDSLALLRSLGVERTIEVGADPGWAYVTSQAQPVAFELPRIEALAGRKKLAVIARLWEFSHDWEEKFIRALRETLTPEWSVVWIAFQWSESTRERLSDRDFLESMRSQLGDDIPSIIVDRLSPDEALSVLRHCDAAFSMRLHASILTIALEIPTATLEYDRKMAVAHDMAGMPVDLRLQLTDDVGKFSHALRRLVGANAPIWVIGPAKLKALSISARVHEIMLNAAMTRVRDVSHPKDNWRSLDFDWVSTWLEQAIWQKNAALRMREKALEILRFRDSQLSASESQRDEARAAEQAAVQKAADYEKRASELSDMYNESQRALADLTAKLTAREEELSRVLAQADETVAAMRREFDYALDLNRKETDSKHDALVVAKKREFESIRKYHRILSRLLRAALSGSAVSSADSDVAHPSSLRPKMLVRKIISTPRAYAARAVYILRHGGVRALASAAKRHYRMRRAIDAANLTIVEAGPRDRSSNDTDFWYGAAAKLQRSELVIISPHRYDWSGAAHRHAQLTLAALQAGHRVVYLYVWQRDSAPDGEILQIPGLIHQPIDSVTLEYVFERVSESARLVIGAPDSRVSPFFQYAKHRGVETIFDVAYDWTYAADQHRAMYATLVAQADRCTAATPALAEFVRQNNRDEVEVLPGAALHTVFDLYKTFEVPDGFLPNKGRVALCYSVSGLQSVDWVLVREIAQQSPNVTFCFIADGTPPRDMPANVIFRAAEPLARMPAYIAHAHFLFFPLLRSALLDGDATAGIYAGLHLRKPVVSSLNFGITPTANLHVCQNETSFVAHCTELAAAQPAAFEDDSFVSKNSYIGRLEHLCPPAPRRDVSVIILIHNNAKIIARTLETLLAHCAPYLADVIVVDNASVDGGAEIVEQQFPQVKLVRNPENGCSSGRNLGVAHSTGSYIAFFDSDQWFTGSSGFAEALHVLENDASVGVIGWNAGWFDKTRTDLGGMIADYCPNRAMNAAAIRDGYRADIGFLGTSGFFMRRRTFDATNGFDTFYDPTCFEDTDLCFQIKALGMKVTFRDLSGIRHQPHQTTQANSGSDKYTSLFLRNAQYFKEKWRDYPHFYLDYTW